MNSFRESIKEKVLALREKGYSYSIIREKTGISKGTLSDWLSGVPFNPNAEVLAKVDKAKLKSAIHKNRLKIANIEKMTAIAKKDIGKLSMRDIMMVGVGVYIGEGTKAHEVTQVVNSNPEVIQFMIFWFKNICGLTNDNIAVAIYLYPDSDIEECIAFWSDVTGLPETNFRKCQIDRRTNKKAEKRNMLPYGTARITITARGDQSKGVELHRRIAGWIAEVYLQTKRVAGIV